MASNTAGAGPDRLDRWTPGVELRLVRNESYWRGPAPIERVVMKIVPAAADRMMLLSSGALDVVERLSAEEIEALSKVEGVRVLSIPSTSTVQLGMNNRMPPFDDLRVRRAIAQALPYDDLLRHVYFGRALRAVGPVPRGFPGRVPGDSPYEHDPETSRALLAEAGFKGGLDVELAMDSGSPDDETLAVFVRAALARVGLRARIRKRTPAVFAEERARRRLPLFLAEAVWWVYDPAYTPFSATPAKGFNHVGYSSRTSIASSRPPGPTWVRSASVSSRRRNAASSETCPRYGSCSPTSTWRCATGWTATSTSTTTWCGSSF
jgi:peptide/nickel transport system substrate-binding protein